MSTHANARAHKDALGTLAALVFDKKSSMNDQEYLEANAALMKLRETADALARSNSAVPAVNATNTERSTAEVARSDSEESTNNPSRQNFEWYVMQVNDNAITAVDLVSRLQRSDELRHAKVDVVQAIYELVYSDSDSVGTARQTEFGAAGAIEALASELALSHDDPTYPLGIYQIKLLATLDVLVRFHATNKERFGAARAFRVVTRFVRYGTPRVEKVATTLLANASFQHDNNQEAMVAAGTVEAIVELMREASDIDRVQSFLKLLYKAVCNSKLGVPVVGRAAVEQGVIPVLLRLAGVRHAAVKAMEVLYKIFDDDEAMRDKVVAEGGIRRMTDVLKDPANQLEERAMAAKLLGEMGCRAPANRRAIVARGVIPVLKELQEEPTGRSRNFFEFALSRLDEEAVDSIAAREVARAREAEAKSKALEEKRKHTAARRKESVERMERIRPPIAKKRARK